MPVESVKVTQNKIEVAVRSTGQKLVVSSPKVQIATVGKVGPSGPAGTDADAAFEWVTQSLELADPQQEFVLDFEPRAGSVFVYLNGLLERFWGLVGTTLTLEDSALEGDAVLISYQKEA